MIDSGNNNKFTPEELERVRDAAPELLKAVVLAYEIETSTTQTYERELRKGYLQTLRAAIAKAVTP